MNFRSFGLTLVFLTLLSLGFPHPIQAQESACNFGSRVEDLKKLQTSQSSDTPERVVAELTIRKDLLKMSIGCIKEDAESLDEELLKVKTSTPEDKAFTEWLHRQIQENISFYSYKQTQIDNLGLKGAKDTARELIERKNQNDRTVNSLAVSLIDWQSNQILFETGAKRFSDIKKTLDAFKLPADHEVIVLEKEAVSIFNAASLKNQSARKDFLNREVEEGRTKTKESLEELAKAYEVFLKISEVSKKTLPL